MFLAANFLLAFMLVPLVVVVPLLVRVLVNSSKHRGSDLGSLVLSKEARTVITVGLYTLIVVGLLLIVVLAATIFLFVFLD